MAHGKKDSGKGMSGWKFKQFSDSIDVHVGEEFKISTNAAIEEFRFDESEEGKLVKTWKYCMILLINMNVSLS